VDEFAERRVELPLFSKEDCYEFLQKQLQDQPKYAQVSQMQSDTIWYSSQGLPKDIIEQAKKNLSKLFSGQESSENFDKANKSWYMTAGLAAAALILIISLAISMGGGEGEDESDQAQVALEEISNDTAQPNKDELDALAIEHLETAEERALDKPIKQTEKISEPPTVDELSQTDSKRLEGGIVAGEESKVENDEKTLTESEVEEAAQTADPIESIALKVAKKEGPVEKSSNSSKSFKQWLSTHSQDAYSLQLFSHSEESAAKSFQSSLDLADSYVYPADLEGKIRYRVLWGAFDTRAEAKQAVESLPPEILAQKPWIRQLLAISQEVSAEAD